MKLPKRLPLSIEWEEVGKVAGNLSLKLLEYSFKLLALLAGGIAMGTPGLFSDKLGAAFSGLTQVLRKTVVLPGELMEMGRIIRDFNVQNASQFTATHGTGAIGNMLFDLNHVVEYAVSVYGNLTGSFFSTLGAAFFGFITFFLLATVLRFARQKGQGSYLVQWERKLGDRIFFKKHSTATGSSSTSPPASMSQPVKTAGKSSFGMKKRRTNSYGFPTSRIKSEPSGTRSGFGPGPTTADSKVKPGSAPKQNGKKQQRIVKDDIAADSQTLKLIIESARASD